MKFKIIIKVMVLLGLFSCQSTEPVYTSKIKEIESIKLFDYWIPKPPRGIQKAPNNVPATGVEWTYFVTIDSNGKAQNLELISSIPEGFMTQERLKKWNKMDYKPSPQNSNRTPVRLKMSVRIEGKKA
ncbi:hypothetical protein RI845_07290 [Thalassotalea nanhaiensis]|uniref:Energy transducer TonB n=1 Tax=Thalassotalea nanhaiensis TaxID=3065648 RepID=A0ABY9TM56_9GAMM|nr:hypothetical protein RI845_07290 [Colwelliaceae bacterium SQ345]